MKNTITNSWKALHPNHQNSPTDFHYIAMAESILLPIKEGFLITKQEAEWIACTIIGYIEDKLSSTQVFNAFCQLHYSFYQTYIPFYKTSNRYSLKNINKLDIAYLLWSAYTQIGLTNGALHLISPHDSKLISIAEKTYQLTKKYIKNNFELKNTTLWNYYFKTANENHIELIKIILSITKQNYLFTTYEEFLRIHKIKNPETKIFHSLESYKPLIMDKYPHEWYALILEAQQHSLAKEIKAMEIRAIEDYLFEFSDFNAQVFSQQNRPDKYYHIRLNKHMDITKLIPGVHYLNSALLKFKGNWELYPPVSISRNKKPRIEAAEFEIPNTQVLIKGTKLQNDHLNLIENNYFRVYDSTHDIINHFHDDPYRPDNLSELLKQYNNDPLILHWMDENHGYLVIPELSKYLATSRTNQSNIIQELMYFIKKAPKMIRVITYSLIARDLIKLPDYKSELSMLNYKDLKTNKNFMVSFFKQII
ncbi:MAG: DUF3843 family protein [Bacteroidales bacterium]